VTQIDRFLASMVVAVFLFCVRDFTIEQMKLQELRTTLEITKKFQHELFERTENL
jgi:uncharacterized membrane protein (DUF106 family)